MSTSSCQNEQYDREKLKAEREEEVYKKSKEFLRIVAVNLCIPEGVSGQFDTAFNVDRQKCIARAMKELGEELADENSTQTP